MHLELSDGNTIVFNGIAFVPFFKVRLSKGKPFTFPFNLITKRRIKYFEREFVFVLIYPEQVIGIKEMMKVDGQQISDMHEYHLLEYLIGHRCRICETLEI